MREIKFRAWDNVENKMYYPGEEEDIHFYFDGSGIMAERLIDIEECTPEGDRGMYLSVEKLEHLKYMQYTGLKDKNGVEIYEGDIISGRNRTWDLKARNEEVIFLNGCFMFGNWNAHEYFNKHQEIQVMGNIHENLDLLEVKA